MDSEDDYFCEHLTIIDDTCQGCGLEIEDTFTDCTEKIQMDDSFAIGKTIKKESFNYYNRLALLELDPKIGANVCRQISKLKEKSHVRVPTHLKNLFVMIYIAYNTENVDFNPAEIGKKMNMKPKDIRDAVKIAAVGIDEFAESNPVCIISPFNFIRELSYLFKDTHVIPEKSIKKIEEFIDLIMGHNHMLGNENPKGIATAIIKMYYDQNRIIIPNFLNKTKRTLGYIKTRENMIIKTLNSIV